jgi:hypothetical protein
MDFQFKKFCKKPVEFVKNVKETKKVVPNLICNPIHSSAVPNSTKRKMLRHSPKNSLSGVTREVLHQCIRLVSCVLRYLMPQD